MGKLNFQEINDRVLSGFQSVVQSWLPSGKREGDEWVALNPTRADRKPGSFRINVNNGRWADFATNDKGGDPISLYAYLHGMEQGAAAKELAAHYGMKSDNDNLQKARSVQPAIQPVPADAPAASFKHYKFGQPSRVWDYRDQGGNLLGYILRYDTADGKEILPLTWVDGKWQWKSFPKPRPLYGLEHLSANPAATVLIVEGEKAADAAQAALPMLAVVTWPGGSKAVQYADFAPLKGRKVIIWPDNDEPGTKAALEVATVLRGVADGIRFIQPPAELPEGWDAADCADLNADFVRDNLVEQLFGQNEPVALPANDNVPAARPVWSGAVDVMSLLPDANDKGKPLATIENLAEVCRRLGVVVRYNVITKEEEILVPDHSFSIDNAANASLSWLISWCARFKMPTDKVSDFVTYLADQNPYNPVAEWIMSKPWDGTNRIADLCNTIQSTDNALRDTLLRRWLVSAVAAAFEPDGVSAHGVLVLQGEQYLGKTKWFKSLVPAHLGVVQDGMMLRPDDRDSVKQVCSFWLVELGELDATFRKSDIAALKSFITRKNDVIRRAYARKESQYARRTVFFGSVNPKQFLHDATGNRRYWTIEATHIDHSHKIDMQQLWAEVYHLYRSGESYYLTPQEMDALNNHNEDFTVSDPIQERIESKLAWTAEPHLWDWRSATDILVEIGMDRPSQSDVTKAATIIRKMNGNQSQRKYSGRLLLVPPKVY